MTPHLTSVSEDDDGQWDGPALGERSGALAQSGPCEPRLDVAGSADRRRGGSDAQPPRLSIAMPTRNRPRLLERALRSVVDAVAPVAEHIEVAVSDGSDDSATGDVVARVLPGGPVEYRYVWNRPALSLVDNINRAVEISSGPWVMQLHDDDYLLPGAGAAMLDAARRAPPGENVLLFGVHIVDINGVRRRQRTFSRERYLAPNEALRRVLRNSSFVRQPAVVVRRAALEQEGLFNTTVGGATDFDMWVRLFSRYGVRCLPQVTCAYTIHEAAATTGMWNPRTIRANAEIFDRAVARGIVPERVDPALAGRLVPPVHPRRRIPPPTRRTAGRGP